MSSQNPIRLGLVDDEKLFVKGMQSILSDYPDLDIVMTASDGSELIGLLDEAVVKPDILVLDLRMKPMNGVETSTHLKECYPDIKVIILSTYYKETFLGYMLKLGVSAFLPKNIAPDTLVQVIRKVQAKGLYFTEDDIAGIQKQLLSGYKFKSPDIQGESEITAREAEVLKLICDQKTSAEIAEKLFVSIRTVEGHRNNLLIKTGAKNTVGLVLYALLHGLIDIEKKLVEYTLS